MSSIIKYALASIAMLILVSMAHDAGPGFFVIAWLGTAVLIKLDSIHDTIIRQQQETKP